MKHLILALVLLFSTPVLAMNEAQQQLRQAPAMQERCVEQIEYYQDLVWKFEDRIEAGIGNKSINKLKLNYCQDLLEDWENYCNED